MAKGPIPTHGPAVQECSGPWPHRAGMPGGPKCDRHAPGQERWRDCASARRLAARLGWRDTGGNGGAPVAAVPARTGRQR
jgi:hypothetical protein